VLHGCLHGLGRLENGKLLAAAATQGFEAFLTKDANLQYEQNLMNLPLAVVVLEAASNDIEDIRPLIPALLVTLAKLPPRSLARVPGP
jgi:hypothetical protein